MSAATGDVLASHGALRPGGVAGAVLHEIATCLAALGRDPSREDCIDLNSLPMSDADRQELRDFLGRGEVDADCNAAGRCHCHETGLSGVWWVAHFAQDGAPLFEQIVVARVPALLGAHPEDILDAHRVLEGRLGGAGLERNPADPL